MLYSTVYGYSLSFNGSYNFLEFIHYLTSLEGKYYNVLLEFIIYSDLISSDICIECWLL